MGHVTAVVNVESDMFTRLALAISRAADTPSAANGFPVNSEMTSASEPSTGKMLINPAFVALNVEMCCTDADAARQADAEATAKRRKSRDICDDEQSTRHRDLAAVSQTVQCTLKRIFQRRFANSHAFLEQKSESKKLHGGVRWSTLKSSSEASRAATGHGLARGRGMLSLILIIV